MTSVAYRSSKYLAALPFSDSVVQHDVVGDLNFQRSFLIRIILLPMCLFRLSLVNCERVCWWCSSRS